MTLDRRVWIWLTAATVVAVLHQWQPSLLGLPSIRLNVSLQPPSSSIPNHEPLRVQSSSKSPTSDLTDPWSLETISSAFLTYQHSAGQELQQKKESFHRLSIADQRVAAPLDYPGKLARFAEATKRNSEVTDGIARLAAKEHGVNLEDVSELAKGGKAVQGGLFRVREALLHFMRDWSEEGKGERQGSFGPILDVLRDIPAEERNGMKVLVPGAGLGRLAWDISELGYDTTANELSWYMNLAFSYLLDPLSTPHTHAHTTQPFSHRLSNQRSNTALFRNITFPDTLPRRSERFELVTGDFYKLLPPIRDSEGDVATGGARKSYRKGYDVIVTMFFIDTSSNVLTLLRQLHTLLAPGGTWINLGPLLWPSGSDVSMELTLEEVVELTKSYGFEMAGEGISQATASSAIPVEERKRRRRVDCEYTADKNGMFRRVYEAEFWVAKKRG